jgi:hypothetical protein
MALGVGLCAGHTSHSHSVDTSFVLTFKALEQ